MNDRFRYHTNPRLTEIYSMVDKPTLGIDLDGVLSSTKKRFLMEIGEVYDIDITDAMYYDSNLYFPSVSKSYGELVGEILENDYDMYKTIEPISGASQATRKLSNRYNIKIITHRVRDGWLTYEKRKRLKSLSINWLKDNNFYFDEFIFPTPEDKSDINADVYIDDRHHNIKNVIDEGNVGILFIRPDNMRSIPQGSWLASSMTDKNINYFSTNEKHQWDIITESLI